MEVYVFILYWEVFMFAQCDEKICAKLMSLGCVFIVINGDQMDVTSLYVSVTQMRGYTL